MLFSRYVVVQLAVYLCELTIFYLFSFVLLGDVALLALNVVLKSFALGAAFFAHKLWTFRLTRRENTAFEAFRYLLSFTLNVLAGSFVFYLLLNFDLLMPVNAKILSDISLVILSFVMSKYYVFR